MWLNEQQIINAAIRAYRKRLLQATPNHLVIDGLFNHAPLQAVSRVLQQPAGWQTQKHSYAALYVNDEQWQTTANAQRFVQRDMWQRPTSDAADVTHNAAAASVESSSANIALEFLSFLRGHEFMALLSRIFAVQLTDRNVLQPVQNTNYFRLGHHDFVNQHADDSPGREVCMLLYLNENWQDGNGGELVFSAKDNQPVHIAPLFNRCVLFDPASAGAEHWVNALTTATKLQYRYNVTSWYWSE